MEPLRERGEPLRERSEPLRKKRHSSDVYVPYYADLLRRSVAQIEIRRLATQSAHSSSSQSCVIGDKSQLILSLFTQDEKQEAMKQEGKERKGMAWVQRKW